MPEHEQSGKIDRSVGVHRPLITALSAWENPVFIAAILGVWFWLCPRLDMQLAVHV